MIDIVSLGELLVDMFPAELARPLEQVSAFRPKPGGAPANVSVAVARLGLQSAFIGKVGDDAFGHHLASVLAGEGVNVSGMRYDRRARTPLAFIAMPDVNSYEILFYRNPGADMRLKADELEEALLRGARAFHFGSISLIQEPSRSATLEAARIARAEGALISFDVNYRPDLWSRARARSRVRATLPHVSLLKVNEIEAEILTGSRDPLAASQALLDEGMELCLVTLGPEGSIFRVADGADYVPAFQVDTVDATGCGDAFVAGMLCQLVRAPLGWRSQLTVARMREIVRYASAVAALTAATLGVIPALPSAAQVDAFLERNCSAFHHVV